MRLGQSRSGCDEVKRSTQRLSASDAAVPRQCPRQISCQLRQDGSDDKSPIHSDRLHMLAAAYDSTPFHQVATDAHVLNVKTNTHRAPPCSPDYDVTHALTNHKLGCQRKCKHRREWDVCQVVKQHSGSRLSDQIEIAILDLDFAPIFFIFVRDALWIISFRPCNDLRHVMATPEKYRSRP